MCKPRGEKRIRLNASFAYIHSTRRRHGIYTHTHRTNSAGVVCTHIRVCGRWNEILRRAHRNPRAIEKHEAAVKAKVGFDLARGYVDAALRCIISISTKRVCRWRTRGLCIDIELIYTAIDRALIPLMPDGANFTATAERRWH